MKILHLVQKPQLRGAEVFTSQLSNHLNQLGHEVVLVCLFPGKAELPFKGKILELNGNIQMRLFDYKAYKRLAKIMKNEQPDLVQANAGDTLKYAVVSKILFGWKQPVIFRNASTISLYIKNRTARFYNNLFFRYASKIISVSRTSANDFGKLYPRYRGRIITIPIGIETSINGSIDENKSAQKRLEGNPAVVHVGGFTYEKNHMGLLSIFDNLIKHYPGAKLHLVGSGPLQQKIEELVNKRIWNTNVIFHGHQNRALDFISKADVLVLPSIIEGLPGVILEAFYCKTPVVAYNVGGINEILINNKTGRLIEANNEIAFVDAVLCTIEQTEENKNMIDNAHALVISDYLNTEVAKRFLSIYESILN